MKGDKKDGSRFVAAPPVWATTELSERIRDVPDRERRLLREPEPRPEAEGTHHANRKLEEPLAEPRQVEAALVLSEEMFREAFDRAPLGMVLNSPNGRRLKVNRAFCRMLGYSEQVLMGMSLESVFHSEDQDALRHGLHRLVTGEIDRDFQEWRYIHADGHVVFADVSASAVRDAQGVLQYIVVQVEDVTERQRAREALREAEQKYRDIFENASEGIFQTTPDGQYIVANPALAKIHGFESPEELIRSRKDISRQVYVDPTGREEFKQVIEAQGFVHGFEHQIFHRNGSKIWVSINARVVRNQHGEILYYEGTTQDINERKVAEARSAAFGTLAQKLSGATTKLGAARVIVETARELFGWDSCNLDLYDADRDLVLPMLKVDTIEGRRVEISESSPARKPTDRSRRVINDGPLLIFREDPIQFDNNAVPFGNKLKPSASIMTVPIRHATTLVGLLSIQSYMPRAYNAAALDDLQSLADHCGEALNRIQVEESFLESEERFRQLAHHLEDVVWLTDKYSRNVLYINPAYETIFRRTSESVYERMDSFLDKIHSEDRVAVERMLEKEWKGDHTPLEYRIVWPDGSVRWILRRTFPIRNTEGEIYLIAGIAQDITERKRAEEALRESEERYRELFENAKDAIYVHDLSGRYVSVNRAAESLSGYSREEILGKHYSNFVAPRNLKHARTNLCKKLDESNETIYEVFMITRDKRAVPVEVSSRLIHENGLPVGVQGIVRDITERKRAQDALQNYSRRLIEAQEAERQHIARELHDEIGQVLTAVKINLQSIQSLGPDSAWMPPLDESIGIVDEALGRVRELSIELRPSLLDDLGLSAALRWYVDRYAQRTGIRAEVTNGFEEEGRLPRELETACFRIAQEALTNVVRHAKAKSVSVQLERLREKLVLTISDDGVGFDVEGLFSNAATVAALGLRGMEERALALKGKIEIESALQNGTRIRASFPFKLRK